MFCSYENVHLHGLEISALIYANREFASQPYLQNTVFFLKLTKDGIDNALSYSPLNHREWYLKILFSELLWILSKEKKTRVFFSALPESLLI